MNIKTLTLSLLPLVALVSQLAHAAPAGQVTQLDGFASSVRAGGALKTLAPQSAIEPGDTLQSEPGAYVRIALPDGAEAILGPNTRIRLHASSIELLSGQLRYAGGVTVGAVPFTVRWGDNTIQAGNATFDVFLVPDPNARVAQAAQLAYARAAMASLAGPVTDAGAELPLLMAQVPLPGPSTQSLPAGLYVHAVEGLVSVTNKGSSLSFAPGQFGYTPSFSQPPTFLPKNPGLVFQTPVSFVPVSSSPAGSGSNQGVVDCEVR